ncbi:MAG TPA: hypothetical protein VEA59_05240 [Patescibacteria group bacterium]|nr:hypothetical protein [Patescibacteria group bacterium]
MGFHVCEYCPSEAQQINKFSRHSSGDVTLKFAGGSIYTMPDMVLHYVGDHQWLPPAEFISDVMTKELALGSRLQTKSASAAPKPVGYLHGTFSVGKVPPGFLDKLGKLMRRASLGGARRQTRGGGV